MLEVKIIYTIYSGILLDGYGIIRILTLTRARTWTKIWAKDILHISRSTNNYNAYLERSSSGHLR